MDNKKAFSLEGNSNESGIFKTIFLFLQHNKLTRTAETLRKEWKGMDIIDLEKTSGKAIVLTRCKCAKNQANQTERQNMCKNYCQNDWLEGTFQAGETFQLKSDDAHIFYICDHLGSQQNNDEPNQNNKSKGMGDSPRYEVKDLKSKFSQLQDEHHKLIVVTNELTTALQMNILGQTKNIKFVLEQCRHIYPNLFDNNLVTDCNNITPEKDTLSELNVRKSLEIRGNVSSKLDCVPNPCMSTLLTPESVRYILDIVFDRIVELEKSKNVNCDMKTKLLKKKDVDKIVGDVLNETIDSPSICGTGEGDLSIDNPIFIKSPFVFYIDFAKLKDDLIHDGENERKIRILQALRWRITKHDGTIREKVLDAYVANDLLDLFTNISIPERLLLGLDTDHYVQESICRLINALASLRQGRDYLTLDDSRLLKRVLIRKVKDVKSLAGAVIRNMLVASVQKLSIRKHCRQLMVEESLLEVVVDYMDEFYEKLSKYCLEYCSALLMNLCLVEAAKERIAKNPQRIMNLLRKFLNAGNEIYLPYINGVMFSLFEKSDIVREASFQHFDQILIKLIQCIRNESIRKQLDFILQFRLQGKNDSNLREDEGHDDVIGKEEVDLLEIELDQDDFISQLPSGEILLQEYTMTEEPHNMISHQKDGSNSSKSDTDGKHFQFAHKSPLNERADVQIKRSTGMTTFSQNVIKNDNPFINNNKSPLPGRQSTCPPFCYMENCQKFTGSCSCSKCVPGQSRYSCSCYEAIKKEVSDNDGEETNANKAPKTRRW